MIHYTCDRCHREIDADVEVRYAVEIETKAIFEPSGSPPVVDDDSDHLLELHEILERLDEDEEPPCDAAATRRHFDLCSDCYKIYSRNPIARDMPLTIEFSKN